MRQLTIAMLVFVWVCGGVVQAEKKIRDWQTGTWRDTARTSERVGSETSGTVSGGSVSGSTVDVRRVSQFYVIETDDFIYQAEQRLRWRWSNSVPLTVNDSVKFAIEKNKLYVIGEDGKEYELSLIKKIKRIDH